MIKPGIFISCQYILFGRIVILFRKVIIFSLKCMQTFIYLFHFCPFIFIQLFIWLFVLTYSYTDYFPTPFFIHSFCRQTLIAHFYHYKPVRFVSFSQTVEKFEIWWRRNIFKEYFFPLYRKRKESEVGSKTLSAKAYFSARCIIVLFARKCQIGYVTMAEQSVVIQ